MGTKSEFDFVPRARAILKTMFDVKPITGSKRLLAGIRMGSGRKRRQLGLCHRCHKAINKTACFPQ